MTDIIGEQTGEPLVPDPKLSHAEAASLVLWFISVRDWSDVPEQRRHQVKAAVGKISRSAGL